MSFLEEHRKEMRKMDQEEQEASNEISVLINNFLKFVEMPSELNSLLAALLAMVNEDRANYPDYSDKFEMGESLCELSSTDFGRLCEIAMVMSGHGLNAFEFGDFEHAFKLSGQFYSAVFEEAIRR